MGGARAPWTFQQTIRMNVLSRFTGRPKNRRWSHDFTFHSHRAAMVFGVSKKSLMPETTKSLSHMLLHFPKLDRDIFRHDLSQLFGQCRRNLIFGHGLGLLLEPPPPKKLGLFQSR